ncbi:MAG: tetratricopeptide repeat protein [bacterium]
MAISAMVLAGCPASAERKPRTSMTYFKLGHDYFSRAIRSRQAAVRERFINVALFELRKSLKYDDQNHHAHFLIALIYLYKGQRSAEETEVLQCLEGPEVEPYRKEADALMRKSLSHFETAFKLRGSRDSRVALNLSTVYLYFKNYVKAEELGRLALSDIAYSTPHLARNNVGRAQFHRGRLLSAKKNLKQAVFSEPRFCPGYYWLGRVEFAEKKHASAAKIFAKALECCVKEKLAPIQGALLYRGLSLVRVGQQQESLAAFEQCVKQAPKSCVAARCRKHLKTVSRSRP